MSTNTATVFLRPAIYDTAWVPPKLVTSSGDEYVDAYDYATAQFMAAAVAQTYVQTDDRVLPRIFKERIIMTPGSSAARLVTVGSVPPSGDDKRLTIVVAIRGTESMSDWGANFDFNVIKNPWSSSSSGGGVNDRRRPATTTDPPPGYVFQCALIIYHLHLRFDGLD